MAKKSKEKASKSKSKKTKKPTILLTAASSSLAAPAPGGKPHIVIEGDSWERLPSTGLKSLPTVGGTNYDLDRALKDLGFPRTNLAFWGDTLREIVKLKAYMAALKDTGAPILLLGGGGNDLLADGNLRLLLNQFLPDRPIKDYLLPQFHFAVDAVMANYAVAFADVARDPATKNTRIFVHGYDNAKPMRLGWIGKPMEFHGINPEHGSLQQDIANEMMKVFNRQLKKVAGKFPNVTYVDFRGIVGDRWHDELHPRKEAFADLAAHLVSRF